MPAVVWPGLGTLLAYSTNIVTPAYTTVSARVSIDGPNIEVGEASTSTLDSTWETNRPTLPDPGDLTLNTFWDPTDTTHIEIVALIGAAAILWKVTTTATGPHSVAGLGWVKSFAPKGMTKDDNLQFDLTIRFTGPLTFV